MQSTQPEAGEAPSHEIGGRQRDSRVARQLDRVVRLVRLRGVQHLLRKRVLPIGESDSAAVEHGRRYSRSAFSSGRSVAGCSVGMPTDSGAARR